MRKKYGVLGGVIVIGIIFSSLLPFVASRTVIAAEETSHPQAQAQIYAAHDWLRRCAIEKGFSNERTRADVESGAVFYNSGAVGVGYLFANVAAESADDGRMDCTTGGAPNPQLALGAIGVDTFDFFSTAGIYNVGDDGVYRLIGQSNPERADLITEKFKSEFTNMDFSSGTVSEAARYFGLYSTYRNGGCYQGASDTGAGYDVSIVSPDTGEVTTEKHYVNESARKVVSPPLIEARCDDIVEALSNYSSAASQAVAAAVAAGDVSPGDIDDDTTGGASQPIQNCQNGAGVLGWILCPVVDGVLKFFEFIVDPQNGNGILVDLMQIEVLQDNSEVREVANGFRNLANIILVIAFLIIIFSAALSVGPETYTVKKMLPKLIVAGILTQISLFVGAILIDFFNVLGYGIGSLILSPISSPLVTISGFSFGGGGGASNVVNVVGDIGLGALTGVGAVAAAGGAIWLLLLSLPTIALAIAAVVVILGLRKLAIILMIVAMPIAFALYVFPATEKFAKEWFDNLIKMLAMFPLIIMLIAGGALLASMTGVSDSPNDVNVIESVTSLVALFGPYLLIPFTFKFAGRALGAVSGGIRGLQSRALGGGGKAAKGGQAGGNAIQKHQDRVRKMRTNVAAGQGYTSRQRGGISGVAGAAARWSARSGTGLTKKSERNAEIAYTQAVMGNTKQMVEEDPQLAQNKHLQRIMQYGSLEKAKSHKDTLLARGDTKGAQDLEKAIDEAGNLADGRKYNRTQRASMLYMLATQGNATEADVAASAQYATQDGATHQSYLNDVVGATNKKAGNLGATSFNVSGDGRVSVNRKEAINNILKADPGTLARDKHLGEGGDTHRMLVDELGSAPKDSEHRKVIINKLLDTQRYSGAMTQEAINQIFSKTKVDNKEISEVKKKLGEDIRNPDGSIGNPADTATSTMPHDPNQH